MATAISVSDLSKRFGRTRALDGLDLSVTPGEVHGFLGPNGAGKTTTIRILLGLLRADAGTARVLDRDPWNDAVALHRELVYVPGDVVLWPNLTGGEAIDLLARLRGGVDRRRRDELLERFDLDPTKKGRSYSKAGVTRSIGAGDAGELPRLVGSALVYTPALWVFVGLAVALYGLVPRAVGVTWGRSARWRSSRRSGRS